VPATSGFAGAAKPSAASSAECPEAIHLDITVPAREQAVYLLPMICAESETVQVVSAMA